MTKHVTLVCLAALLATAAAGADTAKPHKVPHRTAAAWTHLHPRRMPSGVVVRERKDTRTPTPHPVPTFDVKDMQHQPAGGPVNTIWYPPMALPR